MSLESAMNFQTDPEIRRLIIFAAEKISASHRAQADQIESEMGRVQEAISFLRNRLIDYYRELESPSPDTDIGRALSRVNTALSYVVGVEYPVSGIHRNLLDKAEVLLKDLPGLKV